MKFSDNGINLLKQLEGCVKIGDKHVVYDDKTGRPVPACAQMPRGATIGYGHLIKPGEDFRNGITENVATDLLRADIAMAERAVQKNIMVPITQNQFDALVIFAYNIGTKNFANSTVVKYINNPNFRSRLYPNLESAWRAWNRAGGAVSKGLIKRRQREIDLFKNCRI